MKRGIGLAIAFILLLSMSSAVSALSNFSIEVTTENKQITFQEHLEVAITITNDIGKTDNFHINIPDVLWTVQSKPLDHYFNGVRIKDEEQQTILLSLGAKKDIPTGTYRVAYTVTAEGTGIKKEDYFFVSARGNQPLLRDYLAIVPHLISVPETIYPGEETPITFNLENKETTNLELIIFLRGDIINEEVKVTLQGLEKKIVTVPITLPKETPPQEARLDIIFSTEGRSLQPSLTEKYIVPQTKKITLDNQRQTQSFLRKELFYTYTNTGNVQAEEEISVPLNFFESIFTKANFPKQHITIDTQRVLLAKVQLEPGQSKTFSVITDYRLPVGIIVFILLLIGAYFVFRHPIKVKKEATILRFKEGGISEIKITLHVINRTKKEFNKVKLQEVLPTIAKIVKEKHESTIVPTDIHHTNTRTTLSWDIDQLDAKEERLITYHIRTKLSILGRFSLPGAILFYHDKKDNKFISRSKKIRVAP